MSQHRSGRRPLVVAHRGASVAAPEHTLAAYRQALLDGADAFECDVRLTADGELVCVHDASLRRTAGRPGQVGRMRYTDLRDVDVSVGWRRTADPSRQPPLPQDTRLLSLAELLELARDGRATGLRIETKRPSPGGDRLERRLVELLRARRLLPADPGDWSVAAMSFSMLSLRYLHALAPSLPLVRLYGTAPSPSQLAALPSWVGGVGPSIALLRADAGLAGRLTATGRLLHVWTVDDPADVDAALAAGVDALITNRPGPVRRHLDERYRPE